MSEQELAEIIRKWWPGNPDRLAAKIYAAGYRKIDPLTDEEKGFIHRRLQGMIYYEEHIRGKLGL